MEHNSKGVGDDVVGLGLPLEHTWLPPREWQTSSLTW